MADETDKPVDREAWRSLLARGGGEPSALTDARIRAAARRAVPPRSARWWLPASLAASMLLAVLVVQWQYESRGTATILRESEVAAPPLLGNEAPSEVRERDSQPEGESKRESELLFDMSPPPPPPMIELPATSESPAALPARADESLRKEAGKPTTAVTTQSSDAAAMAPEPPPVSAPEPAPAAAGRAAAPKSAADEDLRQIVVTGSRVGGLKNSEEALRSPEEWYAAIEELRAVGLTEDADREIERLEAAYPGWLEERLKQQQPKE